MQPEIQVESEPKVIVPPHGEAGGAPPPRWRLATRIAWRLAIAYFVLYTLWIPLMFIRVPPIPELWDAFTRLRGAAAPWLSLHLLHLRVDLTIVEPASGSKDMTKDYAFAFFYLVLAVLITVLWSFADRKRPNYEQLRKWFLVYLRLTLGALMIIYGADKLVPYQFPALTPSTLTETYGDSSPMHLLWAFMGASPLYTAFGGAVELLGGLLLVVPGLTTLGALVSLGAIGNVLILNLGYDVPVKLLSTHMIAMALLLLLPERRRLANFFLLNRRADPVPPQPLFRRKRLNQTAFACQVIFAVALTAQNLHSAERIANSFAARADTPLYGIWSVDDFAVDGKVHPPLVTDPIRWRRVIIENSKQLIVDLISGPRQVYSLHLDPQSNSFTIVEPDNMWSADFTYQRPQPDVLTLTGQAGMHQVTVTLHRDESQFLLTTRGFHWITEHSFVR